MTEFSLCGLLGPLGLPFGCQDGGTGTFGQGDIAASYIMPRLQLVLSLVFVGIILVAIVYVVRAAIQYIQSQGNPEEIENATKSIRAVFIGIGALFVGIAGILLVITFFGSDITGASQGFDVSCLDDPTQPQCSN